MLTKRKIAASVERGVFAVYMLDGRVDVSGDPKELVVQRIADILHYAHSLGLDARDLANTAEGRFTKQIDGEG